MLWPPSESLWGLIYTLIFSCKSLLCPLPSDLRSHAGFSSLTVYHFFSALSIGPGFLPANWNPGDSSACSQLQFCSQCQVRNHQSSDGFIITFLCQSYKAPRSHHCRRCARCVMKMDHHCPWINTCVGHFNHGHFVSFLASAVSGCALATVSLSLSLYYGLNRFHHVELTEL